MDSVVRVVILYTFLLVIFRIAGRRTLAHLTNFDAVLLLIISEQVQPAMVADDPSFINAFLMVSTLIGLDVALSLWKLYFPQVEKWIDGAPTIVVVHGQPLKDLMAKARIDEADILAAARERQGLERMEQIKYAIMERSGGISIIPEQE